MGDWKDDPTSDERWNAGCDFAMTQLCKVLGVDPETICWDAATESVDGDVRSVVGNILRAKYGDDWGPDDTLRSSSKAANRWRARYPSGQKAKATLCFDGGALSINGPGYGDKCGDGEIEVNENDLVCSPDPEDADYRTLKLFRSELIAIRDHIDEFLIDDDAPPSCDAVRVVS